MKTCPICQKSFIAKRKNQIYCDRNNHECRTSFNNEKARKLRLAQGNTPKIITENWKLFMEMLVDKKEVVCSRDFLKGRGVNLDYFTQYKKEGEKGVYYTFNVKLENMDNNCLKIYR
jgi:hypothetical protein